MPVQIGGYSVYKRPYAERFINGMSEFFDLAVWTSATADYASVAVAALFSSAARPIFVWARERCVQCRDAYGSDEIVFVKDLKKVHRRWKYPLSRILVVDDEPVKLQRQFGNLIPITPFCGDPKDSVLQELADWIPRLHGIHDVRPIEKRFWRSCIDPPLH